MFQVEGESIPPPLTPNLSPPPHVQQPIYFDQQQNPDQDNNVNQASPVKRRIITDIMSQHDSSNNILKNVQSLDTLGGM